MQGEHCAILEGAPGFLPARSQAYSLLSKEA